MNQIIIYDSHYRSIYRLDDGFEVSTGFRSPRKPMYRRPERAARGRLFRFPR